MIDCACPFKSVRGRIRGTPPGNRHTASIAGAEEFPGARSDVPEPDKADDGI